MRKKYLICSPHPELINCKSYYAHTDEKVLVEANKKKFGPDWYYYHRPIEYQMNSEGYRMKEVEEVDWDNYILFLGCSFTVGIGILLEDTFVNLVSKQMNIDYVNGAIGGSSPEFAVNNLIYFLNRAEKLPKAVVITWPDISRTMYWQKSKENMDEPIFKLPSFLEHTKFSLSYKDYLIESEHQKITFKYKRETAALICKLAEIKLIETTLSSSHIGNARNSPIEYYDNVKFWDLSVPEIKTQGRLINASNIHLVKARDIHVSGRTHVGIIPHLKIAKYIADKLGE